MSVTSIQEARGDGYVYAKQACEYLDVPYQALRRLADAGHIQERRYPHCRPKYRVSDLERLVKGDQR